MEPQAMPTKVKLLPFKKRVQNAVEALFASSNLAAPDKFDLPKSIDRRKNAEVELFATERNALYEFARAHAIYQHVGSLYKLKKQVFEDVFGVQGETEAGTEYTITRDDVSCLVKVTQPQHRLDRQLLRSTLMLDCKLSAEKADALIKKCEKPGKPPVYLTPTVNE